jgi:phosphonate transport system substrate-binding protein
MAVDLMKKFLSFIMIFLLLSLSAGCTLLSNSLEIDFSKVEEQTQMHTDNLPILKLALSTGISPGRNIIKFSDFSSYLGRKLGVAVEIVQKSTYGEIYSLLEIGEVDIAYVCSSVYVLGKKNYGLKLVAVPIFNESPYYHSLIIVPASSKIEKFEELRNRNFALTDPMSTTGGYYPIARAQALTTNNEPFFSGVLYTQRHDNSIRAVTDRSVDGAAVDSTIFHLLARFEPELIKNVKIIEVSPPFGNSPIVASPSIDPELRMQISTILTKMHLDPEGENILSNLGIDRYTVFADNIYDSVAGLVIK